ncbi:hypothetical protein [Rhodococcus marinonascens]|uniref:hypothetical protein n=1 Tax=Rhodococcus marinonascens TaxID=38311 RepID=UPI0009323906|nr:hypothetical protein [Rhodococcus marinonascens]
MNWEVLLSAVLLLATGSVGSVAVKALVTRKRVRIDGVAVLSDAAIRQVKLVNKRVDELEQDVICVRKSQREHEVWDRGVLTELERQGIEMEPPPELFWI